MRPEDVLARLARPLSLRRRIAYIIATLGGLGGAAVVALLWTTERDLPLRTDVAFGALVLIGLSWAGIGSWALTRRTPLFALDRLVAAWLAFGATCAFAAMAVVITTLRDRVEPALFACVAVLLASAVANLARARRHRSALLRRKHDLGG